MINNVYKVISICIIGSFLIILLYKLWDNNSKERMLKDSNNTVGFLKEIRYNTAVRGSVYGVIKYKVRGKHYEVKDIGDYRLLKIGDSILVKYSINKIEVAEVTDRYYMQKYKHLKDN